MSKIVGLGTANPSQVLTNQTFTAGSGANQAGTMPNNGQKIFTPGTAQQSIAQGYHDGTGYVQGDPNLIAANILSGKSIFGVTGTAQKRQYATGSFNGSSSPVTVAGLAFTPATVVTMRSDGAGTAEYSSGLGLTNAGITVNGTSFTDNNQQVGYTYTWEAWT